MMSVSNTLGNEIDVIFGLVVDDQAANDENLDQNDEVFVENNVEPENLIASDHVAEFAPDQVPLNPIPRLHQQRQAPRSPRRTRPSQTRRRPQATGLLHPPRQTLPPGRAPPPPQRQVLLPTPVWVLPTSTSSLQMSTCHR